MTTFAHDEHGFSVESLETRAMMSAGIQPDYSKMTLLTGAPVIADEGFMNAGSDSDDAGMDSVTQFGHADGYAGLTDDDMYDFGGAWGAVSNEEWAKHWGPLTDAELQFIETGIWADEPDATIGAATTGALSELAKIEPAAAAPAAAVEATVETSTPSFGVAVIAPAADDPIGIADMTTSTLASKAGIKSTFAGKALSSELLLPVLD